MYVTGMRAVVAVKSALAEAGLGRSSGYNGGEIRGWIAPNHIGATGFSVRKLPGGDLSWHVVLSGKPHLRYRKWTERKGDCDTIDLHEPIDPGSLAPRIAAAIAPLGFEVRGATVGEWSNHWDDDVGYDIVTDHPAWLASADLSNARMEGLWPLLKAVAPGSRVEGNVPTWREPLVGYVEGGKSYLTRESVVVLVERSREAEASRQRTLERYSGASTARIPSYLRERGPFMTLDPSGELMVKSRTLAETRIKPESLTNHWGDEVEVWRVPSVWLVPLQEFKPSVPFRLDGETRTSVPFQVIDAQHRGRAPWFDAADEASPSPVR